MTLRGLLLALALGCAPTAHADELRVDGTIRTYTAIVPAHAQNLPLVLVLHGNTQQGHDVRERTSWAAVAARERFVAVFSDGLDRAWADLRTPDERLGGSPPAGTDDTAFLVELARHFVDAGIADRRRVYAAGVSNGGAMALTLACLRPDTFAAVASVAMEFTPSAMARCAPGRAIPVLLMNGTADPLIPYAGGHAGRRGTGAEYLPTAQTLAFWRQRNGCAATDAAAVSLPDVDATDRSTVTRIDSRCPQGADVVLYRVDGGGHRWPDRIADARHPRLVDAILGPQNHDIDGPALAWQFLRQATLP
jgi:polyhydroxybutyrate depolymerase